MDDPMSVEVLLRAECAGDEELFIEARRLLNLHGEVGLVLDSPLLRGYDRHRERRVIRTIRD